MPVEPQRGDEANLERVCGCHGYAVLLFRIGLGRLLILLGLLVLFIVLFTIIAFSHGFLLLSKCDAGRSDTVLIRRITDSWKYERSILEILQE